MGRLGVATTYKDAENLSVGQVLERSAHLVPRKVCVFFKETTLTYSRLDDQSSALAAGLQEMGIGKGDRVAIYMFNRPGLYVAFCALQKLGAIVARVNAGYRAHDLL